MKRIDCKAFGPLHCYLTARGAWIVAIYADRVVLEVTQ